jgi:hypothetical protein
LTDCSSCPRPRLAADEELLLDLLDLLYLLQYLLQCLLAIRSAAASFTWFVRSEFSLVSANHSIRTPHQNTFTYIGLVVPSEKLLFRPAPHVKLAAAERIAPYLGKVEHSKPLAISPAAPGDTTTGMTSLLVPWALALKAFPSRSRPPQPRSCDLILHQYRHRNLKGVVDQQSTRLWTKPGTVLQPSNFQLPTL